MLFFLRPSSIIFMLVVHCCLAYDHLDFDDLERKDKSISYEYIPADKPMYHWAKRRPLEEMCFGWKRPPHEKIPPVTVRPDCCKFSQKTRRAYDKICKRRGWIPPPGLKVRYYDEDEYYYY